MSPEPWYPQPPDEPYATDDELVCPDCNQQWLTGPACPNCGLTITEVAERLSLRRGQATR